MANKIFMILLYFLGIGLGIGEKQVSAEVNQKDAKALKYLAQDVVSHDVGDFVEQFYPEKSRLFIFLNDPDQHIERLQNGVYLLSVHIETYKKHGEFPLGRDILTIKIDPRALNHFFGNSDRQKSDGHGIHIVHCQHQIPKTVAHHLTFSAPKEVTGAFCR